VFPLSVPLEIIANVMLFSVKYEARLEDGTVISKSDGVEFTVKEGGYQISNGLSIVLSLVRGFVF